VPAEQYKKGLPNPKLPPLLDVLVIPNLADLKLDGVPVTNQPTFLDRKLLRMP
jgi:hypothetical protein